MWPATRSGPSSSVASRTSTTPRAGTRPRCSGHSRPPPPRRGCASSAPSRPAPRWRWRPPALDAASDLQRKPRLDLAEIDTVAVDMGETQTKMLRIHRPRNALDAKFCGEFAVTAALLAGNCGRAELTDAFVQRTDVQEFLPKVKIHPVTEKDPDEPGFSPFDRVRLTLRDGGGEL